MVIYGWSVLGKEEEEEECIDWKVGRFENEGAR